MAKNLNSKYPTNQTKLTPTMSATRTSLLQDGELVVATARIRRDNYEVQPEDGSISMTFVGTDKDSENATLAMEFTLEQLPDVIITKYYPMGRRSDIGWDDYQWNPELNNILHSGSNIRPDDISRQAISLRLLPNKPDRFWRLAQNTVLVEVGVHADGTAFVRKVIEPDDPRYKDAMGHSVPPGTGRRGKHKPRYCDPKAVSFLVANEASKQVESTFLSVQKQILAESGMTQEQLDEAGDHLVLSYESFLTDHEGSAFEDSFAGILAFLKEEEAPFPIFGSCITDGLALPQYFYAFAWEQNRLAKSFLKNDAKESTSYKPSMSGWSREDALNAGRHAEASAQKCLYAGRLLNVLGKKMTMVDVASANINLRETSSQSLEGKLTGSD